MSSYYELRIRLDVNDNDGTLKLHRVSIKPALVSEVQVGEQTCSLPNGILIKKLYITYDEAVRAMIELTMKGYVLMKVREDHVE